MDGLLYLAGQVRGLEPGELGAYRSWRLSVGI